MTVYHWQTNSNAAPFFSDPDSGFIDAETAMKALKKLVREYDHPCGLFAAIVETCEPKPQVLARYLSSRALAQQKAIDMTEGGILSEGGWIRVRQNDCEVWYREETLGGPDKWESRKRKVVKSNTKEV